MDKIKNNPKLCERTKNTYIKYISRLGEMAPGISDLDELARIINEKGGKDHSKDMYFSAICHVLPEEKLNKWRVLHQPIRERLNAQYASNEPTERQKEAYVNFNELIQVRNNCTETLPRLLLFMYTEIPPVRANYFATEFVNSDVTESENYIRRDNGEFLTLVLRRYKTAGRYGKTELNLPCSLVEEIEKSLQIQPRKFLFVNRKGEPYTNEDSFRLWANGVLKSLFGNTKISITTLRHIFVSRSDLALETKSLAEQEKIARVMGHSTFMQKRYIWH